MKTALVALIIAMLGTMAYAAFAYDYDNVTDSNNNVVVTPVSISRTTHTGSIMRYPIN